jgi:hypothetical protein
MSTRRARAIDTPAGVWRAFVSAAGLDLKRYDKVVEDEVRATLGLQAGPLRTALQRAAGNGLTAGRLLSALLATLQPWSRMYAELLALFEEIGAKSNRSNLRIKIGFDELLDELDFDLDSFREFAAEWAKATVPVDVDLWRFANGPIFWDLWRCFDQPRTWPDFIPPPEGLARFGVPQIDEKIEVIERLWRACTTAWNELPPGSDRQGHYPNARELTIVDGVLEETPDVRDLLRWIGTDRWYQSFPYKVDVTARNLALLADGDRESRLAQLSQQLEAPLRSLIQSVRPVEVAFRQLSDVVALPAWQRRHELYSVWLLMVIKQAFPDGELQFDVHDGEFKIGFKETLVATNRHLTPHLHLWAELRTPLANPMGKGRKRSIQPDYSLAIEPADDVANTIAVIECKQYLKSSRRSFADVLSDYARGRPEALVALVNYGPIASTVLGDVPSPLDRRCETFSDLRPTEDARRLELMELIRRAVRLRCVPVATQPPAAPARDSSLPGLASITLEWSTRPKDLDLYLRLPDGEVVSYGNTGDRAAKPWALLENDEVAGFGPERIFVYQVIPGEYQCLVNNYSEDARLVESGARVTLTWGDRTFAFTCPQTGVGNWWHVFRADFSRDDIAAVGTIFED